MITYLCYREIAVGQEPARLTDTFLCQVLMRCDLIDPGKKPVKMITGKTGLPGKSVQVQCNRAKRRLRTRGAWRSSSPKFWEIIVDKDFGRDDFFIYFGGDRHNTVLKFLLTKLILVFQILTTNLLAQFMGFTSSIFS